MSRNEINDRLGRVLPQLRRMAEKLCRKFHLSISHYADELVSAATWKIARALASYDPAKLPFEVWARWNAARAMQGWLADNSNRNRRQKPLEHDVRDKSSVARDVEAREREAVVQKALMKLPEPQRCVIGGEFFVGTTHRAMCESLGVGRDSFRSTRTLGLNRLRMALEGVA